VRRMLLALSFTQFGGHDRKADTVSTMDEGKSTRGCAGASPTSSLSSRSRSDRTWSLRVLVDGVMPPAAGKTP